MLLMPRRGAALVIAACGFSLAVADGAEPVTRTVVFRSGEDGYHTYRIPAIVASGNGTLLAFAEGRKTRSADHGDVDLVLRRSTDGGRTWGSMQLIHEEGGTEKITIGNPAPVCMHGTDTIWLAFNRDNTDVFVTRSDDAGATWTTPRDITSDVKQPGWTWYATGPGNGIQMESGPHAGRLVIPCDHRFGAKDPLNKSGRSHVIYSDDQGQSWRLGGVTGVGMNECAVAEVTKPQPGSLLLNMRSYRKHGCRATALSTDGGLTWTEPADAPELLEPVCQGSLVRYVAASQSGELLLFSNPADSQRRVNLTVRQSPDHGVTWPHARTLHAGPSAYSCLVALADEQVGCLYEAGEHGAYETITFARFPLSWMAADESNSSSSTTNSPR